VVDRLAVAAVAAVAAVVSVSGTDSLKVAILGVGLIGGSIGLAARRRVGAQVWGYDPDVHVRAEALRLGAIDEQAPDVARAVRGADVVFAAAPVGALSEVVRLALDAAGPNCVVSDVGSTKRVVAAADADERFVGGHPLAGAETAGVEHAREDLFEGATWYLTPAQGTAGVLYERLHRLLVSFGAQPTAIDADTHDRLMACVSHLPHVLANLLVTQAIAQAGGAQISGAHAGGAHAGGAQAGGAQAGGAQAGGVRETRDRRLPALGPSFRDATRVAGANSAIWTDIYLSNRDALIVSIDETARQLSEVRAALAAGDAQVLSSWNEHAREHREALLGAGLAGGPVHELRVSVPNRPGVIADIALALGRAGVNIVDMALSPAEDNRQGVVALWVRGDEHAVRAQELIGALSFPVARA
jgi:prephenate dehydrogenase